MGYITVSGVVGSNAIRVFGGPVLSNALTELAKQQSVPGALHVSGILRFCTFLCLESYQFRMIFIFQANIGM